MKIMNIKKGFTLIEVMIALVIFSIGIIAGLKYFTYLNNKIFDNEKDIFAQRVAYNYMEQIDNIRFSTWIDASLNPNNELDGSVNLSKCGKGLLGIRTDSVTTDLLGWFCKKIPGNTGLSFSELKGNYSLFMKKDPVTHELRAGLNRLNFANAPGNVENFDTYSTFFGSLSNLLNGRENPMINYGDVTTMKERFEGRKLNLKDYQAYFNNDKGIPGRAVLVTISFRDGGEKELKGFLDSEKAYYKDNIKVVKVKVEYSDMSGKRKEYVLERVMTNFRTGA